MGVNVENGYSETTIPGLFFNKVNHEDNDTLGIIIKAGWNDEEETIEKEQYSYNKYNTAIIYEAIAMVIFILILIVFIKNTLGPFL